MNMRNIYQVVYYIKKNNINIENCSPNFVANIAYTKGISLTSEEVVYISDNIEGLM